jgi:hypothetical protein
VHRHGLGGTFEAITFHDHICGQALESLSACMRDTFDACMQLSWSAVGQCCPGCAQATVLDQPDHGVCPVHSFVSCLISQSPASW